MAVKTGSGKNVTSNTQKNKRNMLIVGLVISIEYKNTGPAMVNGNGPAEIEVTMTLFCHPFEYSQNNCYRPIHPERRFSKKSIFSDLT